MIKKNSVRSHPEGPFSYLLTITHTDNHKTHKHKFNIAKKYEKVTFSLSPIYFEQAFAVSKRITSLGVARAQWCPKSLPIRVLIAGAMIS